MSSNSSVISPQPRRVLLLGGTGTIGRATVRALVRRGHEVFCFVRPRAGGRERLALEDTRRLLAGSTLVVGEFGDRTSLEQLSRYRPLDVLVSCLASRNGAPQDAWSVDYHAHAQALAVAIEAGVSQAVLLSALCVQKPCLAFQHAKLAFEKTLIESGLAYSIVRPTAFFKSLSGQIGRLRRGKPYLLFGDGTLTSCKPIGDRDLAEYLVECLDNEQRRNRILPIGGPGPPITPRQQGDHLFQLLGAAPRFRQVPVALLDAIVGVLSLSARAWPALADKAELARIGRYYATESMLAIDPATGQPSAAATPETGSQTLFGHYAEVLSGRASVDLGDHAVF